MVRPLKLNPGPVMEAFEIATLEPPELPKVTDWVWLFPTATVPKLTLPGFAPSRPGVTEVPERGTSKVEFVAVLRIVRSPVAAPVDFGANVTVKLMLWPAVRVRGTAKPVRRKALPVTFACETATVIPLELVSVAVALGVAPTCTCPKFRLPGFATSDPAATPVADRATLSVGFDALLVMLRFPLAAPAACAAKVMVKTLLRPAVKLSGSVGAFRLNPAPLTVA